jgi:autoinducer 2-degrading protein
MSGELTISAASREKEPPMAQVSVLAKVTAREGKDDELVAAFEPLIDQVRNEPGTLLYVMNRAKDDPNVFWFSELYADEDAFAAHGSSDAMAKAMPALGPLIAESELIVGEPVLAKDLPGLAL